MNATKFITAIIVATLLFSCTRHSEHWETLAQIDSYIDLKPDSALYALEHIAVSELSGREEAAKHALLYSMALDKNFIDTTTFDVLQPAIDYYLTNGNPDEKLRTYYYQGRIFQNKGDDDAAMRSYIKCYDLRQEVSDTLLFAHSLVAQATLYSKQYKTCEFIQKNIEAAGLYGAIGRETLELKSYANALNGYVILNNKSASDSLMSICDSLLHEHKGGETYLFPSYLSYIVRFSSPQELQSVLSQYQGMELSVDETMIIAQGYSRIGEYDKAITLLSGISPSSLTTDSLKYIAVQVEVFEKQGLFEQAFKLFKDYSAMLGRYQHALLSQDLLFSEKKHQLEGEKLMEIQYRDRTIFGTCCGIFALIVLVGLLYYQGYRNKIKRVLSEKETENLKLQKANLQLEISQLEEERDLLMELQKKQSELASPIKEVIQKRLDLLNCLLAKEITNKDIYAVPYNKWIENLLKDKNAFMDSNRIAIAASHPKFIEHLNHHGLTIKEINYLCLYAIGLQGKDVGEYIRLKRHYIISHEIRQKLGIDEHETNIGLYVRRLLNSL